MTAALPGLTVEVVNPPTAPEPLRTDVAGFLGTTRKGPIGVPVRTDGTTDFIRRFGGFDRRSHTAYAVRGYFENEGRAAWVVRVSGPAETASAPWAPGLACLPVPAFRVRATSPGEWANDMTVRITYRPRGLSGKPEFDLRVTAPDGMVEYFTGLPAEALAAGLPASELIGVTAEDAGVSAPAPSPSARRPKPWHLTLAGGTAEAPGLAAYLAAAEAITEQAEVAIVAAPGLHADLSADDLDAAVDALVTVTGQTLDRLVVLDAPPGEEAADRVVAWVDGVRARHPGGARDVAVYHPPVVVPDPLGTASDPLRPVPVSGHIAGVISRLDRERGPYHTPANTVLSEAVDLDIVLGEDEEALLYRSGINLVRCLRGRGLQVWGSRALGPGGSAFVAHRRLIHQLVRAIRTTANPLVFDVNGPELRLTLVRGITSVLLQAFRAGALQGARPEQAFRVRCDETNNPPEQDPGLLVCEIAVAPAVPMEFIRLRLLLGTDGRLEVIEA